MAASRIIEEETGTSTARVHAHNGYFAGDFSTRPAAETSGGPQTPTTRSTPAR